MQCNHATWKVIHREKQGTVIVGGSDDLCSYYVEQSDTAPLALVIALAKSPEVGQVSGVVGMDITPLAQQHITLSCQDGSFPVLNRQVWTSLSQHVEALTENGGHVFIHCFAGHGRTGMAAAILASLGKWTKKDPVAWLRSVYCPLAVETEDQIWYVETILQRTIEALPSKQYSVPAVSGIDTGRNGFSKAETALWHDYDERMDTPSGTLDEIGASIFYSPAKQAFVDLNDNIIGHTYGEARRTLKEAASGKYKKSLP